MIYLFLLLSFGDPSFFDVTLGQDLASVQAAGQYVCQAYKKDTVLCGLAPKKYLSFADRSIVSVTLVFHSGILDRIGVLLQQSANPEDVVRAMLDLYGPTGKREQVDEATFVYTWLLPNGKVQLVTTDVLTLVRFSA